LSAKDAFGLGMHSGNLCLALFWRKIINRARRVLQYELHLRNAIFCVGPSRRETPAIEVPAEAYAKVLHAQSHL